MRKRLTEFETAAVIISVTMGILAGNYRYFTNKNLFMGLIVSFGIIAGIGLFLIHLKNKKG
jgi:ABC-type nickel/cobalt efflux system permease component RcnA